MLKAPKQIYSEIRESLYLILRLSMYETKSMYSMQYLGFLWELVTPILQISVYWFVFGFGIREGRDIDGVPFLPWLVSGIIVWFFISPAITTTARSVYSRIGLVSKMSFPLSTIPAYVLLSLLYRHFGMILVSFVLLAFFGYYPGWHTLWIIYLLISAIALLYSLALLTSALTTIIRDLQNLLMSVMRMMLYLTPIFWLPSVGSTSVATESTLLSRRRVPFDVPRNELDCRELGMGHLLLGNRVHPLLRWFECPHAFPSILYRLHLRRVGYGFTSEI